MNRAEKDGVAREVHRLVDASEFELYDLRVGQDRSLHALIDRRDGVPISVGDVARFNHYLRRELSAAGIDVDLWSIEVESPGVRRPLRARRHYEKSLGQRIRVVRRDPAANPRVVIGILRTAGDLGFTMEPAGGAAPVEIRFEDVSDARLDPELPF
jgi:ribosome maturation factor RimP